MKKSISSIVVICFVVVNSGCYSIHLVDQQELTENPNYPIYAVITSGGEYIEFEPSATLKDSMILGTVSGGPSVELKLASVDSIYVKKRSKLDDNQRQVCCIGAAVLAVVLFIVVEIWVRETVHEIIWGD